MSLVVLNVKPLVVRMDVIADDDDVVLFVRFI